MFFFPAGTLDYFPGKACRVPASLFRKPLQPPEIVPLGLRVHARIFSRRVELEDQARHVHVRAERLEIHERELAQRGKKCREDHRAALLLLLVSPGGLQDAADLRERGDHGAAREDAQHLQLALAQDADALKSVEEGLEPLLRQLSAARAQQGAKEREEQALPLRGAQRSAPAQRLGGAAALAKGEVKVVEHPFFRSRERGASRLFLTQPGIHAPQLPKLRAKTSPLVPGRAAAVRGEQPRARRGISAQLAELNIQSG